MHEENDLLELQDLYKELRMDAKTLIQDMVGGISMYKFSSTLLLALNFYPIVMFILAMVSIFYGNLGFWEAYNIVVPLISIVLFTYFGLKLRSQYSKLMDKYAKLRKIKSELED